MGFSLSPAVSVRELNLSQTVPNIPSARTGMVVRADYGPCLTPTGVTSEADLVAAFGKPTANNYQDWYQAWNFLQYASSLYVVRPLPRNDSNNAFKNAGIHISNNVASEGNAELYNTNKAEITLESTVVNGKIAFFNKYVTPTQTLAIGVCSNPAYYSKPVVDAYSAAIGTISASGASIPVTNNSLVKGNKILSLGTGKIYNVVDSSPTSVTFDYTFTSASDAKIEFSLGYITYTSASLSGITFTVTSSATTNNAKVGQAFTVGGKLAYVTSIAANVIALTSADGTAINPGTSGTVFSNETASWATLAPEYASNSVSGIPAGSTSFNVLSGFNIPVGYVFNFDKANNDLISSITATDETQDAYTVVATDPVNNVIYLDSPLASAVKKINGTAITSSRLYVDLDPATSKIVGINLLAEKFDATVIKKQRLTAEVASDAVPRLAKPYIKEELLSFSDLLEYEPNWQNGEFLTVVFDKNTDGLYEIKETVIASYSKTAKNADGRNIYADNVFFTSSKYLYAKVSTSKAVSVNSTLAGGLFTFGTSTETDYAFTDFNQASVQFAFEEFANPESFDVNILIAHQLDLNYASTIAETRKDCVALVAPFNASELITKTSSEATALLNNKFGSKTVYDAKEFTTFGTYTAVYGNMKYQYDKFNDVNRWVAVLGDIAGLYAQTDANRDPWWAPAGSERGVMKNVIKLAFNAGKQNRDDLYVNAINPIINIPGEGAGVVYGQKTATAIASAFDRVNVRRLLIFLEKTVATAAKTGLFEFNDAFTRQRLFGIIEPFLRTVKSRRGLYDYLLVIDESNNTSSVIDANGMVIDMYLKPAKTAEFINVNAVVTASGTNFAEVVGKTGL